MNTTELNSIINTIVPAIDQHTVLIDNLYINSSSLTIGLIHADDDGTIEEETIRITDEGTITVEGKFIKATDLLELPLAIREVLAFFLVVLRDNNGAVLEENTELELIAANKQFFLDREEAFVPAGLLYAAGIVDEHNMEIDE